MFVIAQLELWERKLAFSLSAHPPSRHLLPNLLSVKAGLLKRELQPTKAVNQGLPSEAGVHMDSNDSPLLPLPATHQSLSPHKHPQPIVRAAGVCCGTQSCLATAPPLRNRNSAQCGPVGREGGSRQMVKGTGGGVKSFSNNCVLFLTFSDGLLF